MVWADLGLLFVLFWTPRWIGLILHTMRTSKTEKNYCLTRPQNAVVLEICLVDLIFADVTLKIDLSFPFHINTKPGCY